MNVMFYLKNTKYYVTIFLSYKTILVKIRKHAAKILQVLPMTFDRHERLVFNQIIFSKLVFKMCRLIATAKTGSSYLSMTVDSSKLPSRIFHTSCGIKIFNVRARVPATGNLLLMINENEVRNSAMQSRHNNVINLCLFTLRGASILTT